MLSKKENNITDEKKEQNLRKRRKKCPRIKQDIDRKKYLFCFKS